MMTTTCLLLRASFYKYVFIDTDTDTDMEIHKARGRKEGENHSLALVVGRAVMFRHQGLVWIEKSISRGAKIIGPSLAKLAEPRVWRNRAFQ